MYYKYNPAQRTFKSAGKSTNTSSQYPEANQDNLNNYKTLGTPKQKHLFFVRFELTSHAQTFIDNQNRFRVNNGEDKFDTAQLSYYVKTVDRPDETFEIKKVNQYNRPRLHYTKVEHNPISMEIHDDGSSLFTRLLTFYKSYYYGNFSRGANSAWYNYDSVSNSDNFEVESNGTFGYNFTNMGDKDETFFFKRISIVEFHGATVTSYNIYNPKIENIILDEKSHESADGNIITLDFQYEGITHLYPLDNQSDVSYTELLGQHVNTSNLENLAPLLFNSDSEFNRHNFFIEESQFIPANDASLADNLVFSLSDGVDEILNFASESVLGAGVDEIADTVVSSTAEFLGISSGNKD